MKVLGFNLTKIHASREEKFENPGSMVTNIEFTDVSKDTLPMLKSEEIVKAGFKYTVLYEPKNAEISFAGSILLSLDDDTAKEVLKSWKKNEIPEKIKIPLINLIMTKCNVRALELEEQLNLPLHLKFPRVSGVQAPKT